MEEKRSLDLETTRPLLDQLLSDSKLYTKSKDYLGSAMICRSITTLHVGFTLK